MSAGATTIGWAGPRSSTVITGTPAALTPGDLLAKLKEQQFMDVARERFDTARNAESNRRKESLIDLQFRCGEQWDGTIKLRREQDGRPCLTINRIPGFLKHVTNAMRQARPEIKVDPIGDGADEDIAEIRQGLIRHILTNSHYEVPADTAFEHMCTMGLGWMRIVDGWDGFDKELYVEWVANPFSIYSDPGARRPDWSDAKWRFVVEDYSYGEFKEKFPHDQAVGAENFQSIGDHAANWYVNGKIRVAEYFHIEEEDDDLCELPDGSTQLLSQMDPALIDSVVQSRPEKVEKVHWTLISGLGVLHDKHNKPMQRIWKGKIIPLIPVIGNQIENDGERLLVGMVRFARESQRMYNYAYSCMVEAIALAPKAPFIAEFSQIEKFIEAWKSANSEIPVYLPYEGKTIDGQLVPPPQRQQAEPPIAALVQLLHLADQNLKATFSIFEAALGERGPQESGIAINSRKIETDVATYDWIDNYVRALHLLGVALNDLLPHYYNRKGRIVQIVREDLSSKPVTLNQIHQGEDGQDAIYDLTKGKFGVVISTGPGFPTRRQEAAKSSIELVTAFPQLMAPAVPEVIRMMDWPRKDAIAALVEKGLPPELRSQDPNAPQVDPQAQEQKLQQLQGIVDQLSKALEAASDQTERERMKEEAATFRVQMQQETALAIAQLKTGSDEAKFLNERIFAELERVRMALEPKSTQGKKPDSSASPESAAAPAAGPSAAPSSSPQEANTPSGVGTAESTQ